MTQIAGLGMNPGTAAKTKQGADADTVRELAEQFAGILNQNTANLPNATVSYDREPDESAAVRAGELPEEARERDYARLSGNTRREITTADDTVQRESDVLTEKIDRLTEDVKELVQETFDVTDEELEQIMEQLGMQITDLLQPQMMVQLIQKLSGAEDVSSLLISADFQVTMEQVNDLIGGFQQENGLSDEQFSDLLAELSAQLDQMEEAVKELLTADAAEQTTPDMDWNAMQERLGAQPENETVILPDEKAAGSEQKPQQVNVMQGEAVQQEQPVVSTTQAQPQDAQTDAEPFDAPAQNDGEEQNGFQNSGSDAPVSTEQTTDTKTAVQDDTPSALLNSQSPRTGAEQTAAAPVTQTVPADSYIELSHLMDQMEGLARTFASSAGTTVEMQLNPENLGRLVLTVTEKHGSVTAQIETTNEQVKESLQAQMIELRATLQAQGVRVDAVEVTVATHEFEQNLDQHAAADAQLSDQEQSHSENGSQGRRNLNRNSLDELSGLMSEEEALVARMMRDNGGTVDFTA